MISSSQESHTQGSTFQLLDMPFT
uniref:Uncharacterized protein n=1 Tax=Timema poppense TaxID=170557 RepID=A0A7R9DT93_TIMPO|nr:unnamed protein product [Timema poppensis]